MTAPAALQVVPESGLLFEEPGALREVAGSAARWFRKYLSPAQRHDEATSSC
nr:hypothetical protein [Deltaproteobacteria bacterium]